MGQELLSIRHKSLIFVLLSSEFITACFTLNSDKMSSSSNNTYCYSNLEDWGIKWQLSDDKRLCMRTSGYCEHSMAGTPDDLCIELNKIEFAKDKKAMIAKQPWVHFPEQEWQYEEPVKIKASFVAAQFLESSLKKLEHQNYAVISQQEAKEIADWQKGSSNQKIYLIRAVTCEGARSNIEFRLSEQGELYVTTYGFTMGGAPRIPFDIERDALVVELEQAPKELFLDCHTRSDL